MGSCYGYRVVRTLNSGSVTTGEREIEPVEAAVVERIFRYFVAGVAPKAIAKKLHADHVSCGAGRERSHQRRSGNRTFEGSYVEEETAPTTRAITTSG